MQLHLLPLILWSTIYLSGASSILTTIPKLGALKWWCTKEMINSEPQSLSERHGSCHQNYIAGSGQDLGSDWSSQIRGQDQAELATAETCCGALSMGWKQLTGLLSRITLGHAE